MAPALSPEQIIRNQHLALLKKAANAEQKKVIKYFTGCFLTAPKDAVYDQMVSDKLSKLNTRQLALNKIGLDEDQLKEIPDVCLQGFQIDWWKKEVTGFSKVGKDRRWRSGKYAIVHLFFSATQVYLYRYSFCMYSDEKKESTEEYFYRDITNFSTSSETVQAYAPTCTGGVKVVSSTTNQFALIVPGDKYYCETQQDIEQSVQAMKAKLREKKNER
ncbi:MAG: hypothetical protein FWD58_04850 [Firmicutes bacterium]|nr:hypothetical protein [Bacillota bacterium]